jgi:hypothetical protein
MIFQTEYWTLISGFFTWIANSAAIMLVLCGVVALSWMGFEAKRRESFWKRVVDIEYHVTNVLKIISFFGWIVGVFAIWAGVMGLILHIPTSFAYRDFIDPSTPQGANHFTCIFLIVFGIAIFLKPVNDLPLSGIIALLIGIGTAIVVALIVPDTVVEWIATFFNPKWILVIIFIVVTIIVFLSIKFWIDSLKLISKVLCWPPISFCIMIFCFIQGFALWIFGVSIPNIL